MIKTILILKSSVRMDDATREKYRKEILNQIKYDGVVIIPEKFEYEIVTLNVDYKSSVKEYIPENNIDVCVDDDVKVSISD